MNIKKSILWRVVLCLAAVMIYAVWVAIKMFSIQVSEGDRWLSLSDSAVIKKQEISPTRGNIYSDDGSLLATSMPSYEVRFDPTVVPSDSFNRYVGALAQRLSILHQDQSAGYYKSMLIRARNRGSRYVLIHRKANYNQLKEMQSWPIFRMGRYTGGMITHLTTKRVRPAGAFAYRTIGYRTKDNPGVGLEREYNDQLAGVAGIRLVQRISGGYRPMYADNLVEPRNGMDVHTTLNVDFQEIAHRALAKALVEHKADHGCVVIMEMTTGQLKAIVNLKNYGEGKVGEAYNYAIAESIEPGSVFKVFSAVAALEDGMIRPEDTLDLYHGERIYFGRSMKDSDHGKYPKVSFKTAFARSSNVAFSSVIYDNYKKDPAQYLSHLKRMELDRPTGIGITGEPKPFLNDPAFNSWSRLTLPWLAIGYENQHTALQVLTAYNAVVNNGKLVRPYLVSSIRDAGIVVHEKKTELAPQRVCSEETSAILRDFAKETVLSGTARNIKSDVVSMAGKTGTAQIASQEGYQSQRRYNASFVGHFPADDPVYTAIVIVNKPSAGIFYASYVAAPVFKELAEHIYTINVLEDVRQDTSILPVTIKGHRRDLDLLASSLNWPIEANAGPILSYEPAAGATALIDSFSELMPDLTGLGPRDALYALEQRGVKVKLKGRGRVIGQYPKAGEALRPDQLTYLQLGL